MPLPLGCGAAGACALTQTTITKRQNSTVAKRQTLFAVDIDLKTFQQGTFGPGAIVKMRVTDETPAAKNCGVRVKIASKTYPSLCWRFELLFFESTGPLRMIVEPDRLASDEG